jgi:hypothetical protein
MIQNQQIASVLQGLRGAQPAIVLLYLALRSALSLAEIEVYTGLSNDSISSAVRGLVGKGWLVEQTGQHGKKYYLPISETFDRAFLGESLFLPGQNPVFPDSAVVVVDESIVESIPLPLQQQQQQQGRQNPVFPDSGRKKPDTALWSATYQKSEAEVEECRKVLDECGIHGRKAARLACLDWVNPEYIRGHVAAVLGEGVAWDNPLGMAITRMEEKYPLEALRENGHSMACTCTQCTRAEKMRGKNRYSASVFDEFLRPDQTGDPDDTELTP